MCIIITKQQNVPCPSDLILDRCFQSNPDGCGVAIKRRSRKEVEIYKGFMRLDDFKTFVNYNIEPEDLAVYHFRITTSGGTSPENCHPFPVSNRIDDLKALVHKSRFAFIHNGIFGPGDEKLRLSDTQLFIKDTLYQLRHALTSKKVQNKLQTLTKGSRTVTIDAQNDLCFMTGNWINDPETGLLFSNSTYERDFYYGYPLFKDDYEDDRDLFSGTSCPLCKKDNTLMISFRHGLLECEDCGCLFDTLGYVWTE